MKLTIYTVLYNIKKSGVYIQEDVESSIFTGN